MSKKTPQIRFKGFTDDWEERKLSSISERVTRKNKNNESTLPLTISAQDGLVDQNDFFNKQVASRDVTGYLLVKNGEFAYNKSYSNGYPWGAIKRLDKYDMGVLSTLYIVFRPTKINSQFLVSYYDTTRWYREVSKNAAEGARNHGLLNIAPTDFFNTLLVVPKIVDEQEKIGSFFKQMDNTIALHQRKLDLLKEQKKGFLQKMFPKNGSRVPELRFEGFSDDWEERKLQEVLRARNKQQPQSMEYPLVSFTVENGVTPKTDRYEREQLVVGDKSSKKYKVTVLNDIVYNPANLKFGAISRNKYGNAVFSPIYITFLVNKDVTTPEFIEMFVTRNDFIKRALKYQQGTVYERQSVSPTDLLAMNVYLPGKSEQEKIGSFFQQLDETIALHQRKLDLLKEQKKGFLQKMFVS
ncbi:type I restriction endonuclease subunit S [Leuconostoc pseudomesenteroides]|nr:type I restriction endonuclease subunit S [Leuconostoc pseudomesenteroides]ORI82201.1 type I restriction endonuclease subunit S [Leuconostoc pseudomesenteroides]